MPFMDVALEQTGSEAKQLRACINDLIGIVALPAIWSGSAGRLIMSMTAKGSKIDRRPIGPEEIARP